MQPSRSSSQLSLEGLPMGGGGSRASSSSGGGRVSASNLRHSASFSNLQVSTTQRGTARCPFPRSATQQGTSST